MKAVTAFSGSYSHEVSARLHLSQFKSLNLTSWPFLWCWCPIGQITRLAVQLIVDLSEGTDAGVSD